MKIDLLELTYDELIELNHKVVMMQFCLGEKVSFDPPGKERQIGTLLKFNKKTVTVITESGQKWNLSPQVLRKVKNVKPA